MRYNKHSRQKNVLTVNLSPKHISGLRRVVLMALLAALHCATSWGQIDPQFTQYWAVPSYYNAGAIGNIDSIHATIGSRLQWVGIRHAPMTFVGLADMPFKFLDRRWGAGVVLQQESMGLYKNTTVAVQLAWKKRMLGGTLSVGLQPGLLNESFDGGSGKTIIPEGDEAHTSADDAIPTSNVGGSALDFSAGVMFTHKKFWVGASCTHIMSPTIEMKVGDSEEKVYEFDAGRTCYFMAGATIPIAHTLWEVMPSAMVKTDMTFTQYEASARVRYNKFLTAGVGYRYQDALMFMLGANYKGFTVGYSYDYATNSMLSREGQGSHEVFVSYNVKLNMQEKNRNKHKSIRIL